MFERHFKECELLVERYNEAVAVTYDITLREAATAAINSLVSLADELTREISKRTEQYMHLYESTERFIECSKQYPIESLEALWKFYDEEKAKEQAANLVECFNSIFKRKE